jgi:putative tryptophan/tyrosine transport system substrate-binding protein
MSGQFLYRRRDLMGFVGGATVAWSIGARAQQPMPVIGYLSGGSPGSDNIPTRLTAFRQGLNEMGYFEGQNVTIEYRWAEGQYDRLPALAADLVRRQVTVIVAVAGAPTAFAAKAATATIPIVFNQGLDPVQSGLVASLNRPGANITGVTILTVELAGKRLDLLHELVPTSFVVALLVNPTNPVSQAETRSLQEAARALGLQAHILRASNPSEFEAAFKSLVGLQVGALVVSSDPLFTNQRDEIVALAARHAMPAIYAYRLFPAAGGLISYGSDLADSYRQTAIYTAKILNGARPADLPVQQVVKIELVINLNTAKALGLTIPLTLSGRADEVIE